MKLDRRINLNVLAALAALLTVADATAQYQIGPRVRSNPATAVLPSAPKPTLVSPAAGEKIQTRSNATTPVTFRWNAPAGGNTPERYLLCIKETGESCGAPSAALYTVQPATATYPIQYRAQVPPRFHDKQLTWAVAACGSGYGGGLALAGATNTDCTWSQSRLLDARYQPLPPNLVAPGDGVTASTASVRFTWRERQGQAVDGYRFCLADNLSSCRQSSLAPSRGTVVAVNAQRTFVDVDLRPLRASATRSMYWTVLSCVGGDCHPDANPPGRRFFIPGAPPPPQLSKPAAGSVQPVRGTTQAPLGAIVNHNFGSHTYPASIDFQWSRVSGASGYKLCISPPGVACGTGTSVVMNGRVQGWESPEWSSLGAFHGQAVNWTVASCDALGCGSWAPPRPLTIKAVPGQVTLAAPAPGSDLTTHPTHIPINFGWSAPSFAEWYVFVAGDGAPAFTRVLRADTNQCRPYRPWFLHLRGATSWKVQACNVVGCGPVSAARAITFYPPATGGVSASTRVSRGAGGSTGGTTGPISQTTCP